MAQSMFLFISVGICLFTVIYRCTSSTVSYCYYGSTEDQNYLLNESCVTGEKHLTNIQSSHSQVPQNISHVTQVSMVTHCIIFKYFVKKNLRDNSKVMTIDTSVYANFSCDYVGLCRGRGIERLNNITYQGFQGDVFCCNRDNCNKRHSSMQDLPPSQQLCYTGTNASAHPTGSLSYCKNPDAVCAWSSTVTQDGKHISSYFCDAVYCKENNMTGSWNETCKTVTMGNKTARLCCCMRSRCLKPPWPVHEPDRYTTTPPSPIPTPGAHRDWLVTGLIIAASTLVGVGVGVVVTVAVYRRRKTRDQPSMTYHRIAADDPAHAENVQIVV